MSLKVKLISCISLFMLMVGVLLIGVFAATQQQLILQGSVNFNVPDKSLYVKDVRLQQDMNSQPQSIDSFMPGYINGDFTLDLTGSIETNTYGSFALYFDIINTTTYSYDVDVDYSALSSISGLVVTPSPTLFPANSTALTEITLDTPITGSLCVTVTNPTGATIDLSNIIITLDIHTVTIGSNSEDGDMGDVTIQDADGDGIVEVGEEITITANPDTSSGSEFIGWQDENDNIVSTDNELTFVVGEQEFSEITALFNRTISSNVTDEATSSPVLYTTYNEAKVAAVTGCQAGATDVEVARSITRNGESYIVYRIADGSSSSSGAFYSARSTLTSVTLPDSLISIGEYAFSRCSNLTSITIPANVETIDEHAFSYCSKLATVNFAENSKLTSIELFAFHSCSSLTEITLPASLTSINLANSLFENCNNLTEINVDVNNTVYSSIDGVLFNKAGTGIVQFPKGRAGSYTIPDGVTSIGSYAFKNCSKLTSVIIPDGVTSIRRNAFDGCSSLTEISIPSSVTSIELFAFDGCSKLTSVIIPDGVTSIGRWAFDGCSSLTEIRIPSSVTSVGSDAFDGCTSLKTVIVESSTIYSRLTGLGTSAAGGILANAETIKIAESVDDGSNSYLIANYDRAVGSGEDAGYIIYTYPVEIAENGVIYKLSQINKTAQVSGAESTLSGAVAIPSSITYQGESYPVVDIAEATSASTGAFYSARTTITSIDLSALSLTELPNYALASLTALQSVTLPDSLISIGEYAFSRCSNLTSITIPANVETIDEHAFSYCSKLATVNFAENSKLTSIELFAFHSCSSLTEITLPASLTSINLANSLFENCNNLTEINVDVNNTVYSSIDGVLFNKAGTGIVQFPKGRAGSYTIPDGVTSIGSYAFKNCSKLTSVIIPDGVTSIRRNAFDGCSSLTEISIPSSVTSIELFAFDGCSKLTSVIIPDGVTSIGRWAFDGCSSLTEIRIPSSVTSVGSDAFDGCTNLKTVIVDSARAYASADSFSSSLSSCLFDHADDVYVLASIRDGGEASCLYLNDTKTFNIPADGVYEVINGQNYYHYTRK